MINCNFNEGRRFIVNFKGYDLRIVAMVAIFANVIFSLLLIYASDMEISGKLVGIVLGMWYLGMLVYYLYQRCVICAVIIGLSAALIPVTMIVSDFILTSWF